MGFFKKIGEKVKRVASLKNAIGLVTGNYLGVAKDAMRIATTNKPVKTAGEPTVLTPDTTFLPENYQLPQTMQKVLEVKGAEQQQKAVNFIASNTAVQNTASQATGFMSKVYIQAMWLKYKGWIIAGAIALVSFLVYWFGFRNKNTSKRRVRR